MNPKKIMAIITVLTIIIIIILIIICVQMTKKDVSNIPEGFNLVEGSDTSDKIIIQDENGNQFVWIPVDGNNVTLSRKTFTNNEITDVGYDKVIERVYYQEENTYSCLTKYKGTDYYISAFKESVEKYGGFYIARYETGKDENGNLVIQEGYTPLTNITRDEALEQAINFYNNEFVVSSLINSYAWDTTLQYIDNTLNGYYHDNSLTGTGKIELTGNSGDEACGIFDLQGNVREWTTEYSSNGYYTYSSSAVVRGGYYKDSSYCASSRYYNAEDVSNENTGYRIIMYLK